jgi:hypothetical protein
VATIVDQFETLIEKIRHARNFDFRNYKRATLRRRVERRMAERGCKALGEYSDLLDRSPEEYDQLLSALLIKVTAFFRDPEMWQLLRTKIVPDVVAGKRTGDEIRVFNTRGEVVAWAHVTPSEQPGSVTLYEGWWPRQFKKGKGVNELTSSAVNPIHEVHFVGNMWAPSTGWKDCRCEIEKAGEA